MSDLAALGIWGLRRQIRAFGVARNWFRIADLETAQQHDQNLSNWSLLQ
jgi:hypothetical protein